MTYDLGCKKDSERIPKRFLGVNMAKFLYILLPITNY